MMVEELLEQERRRFTDALIAKHNGDVHYVLRTQEYTWDKGRRLLVEVLKSTPPKVLRTFEAFFEFEVTHQGGAATMDFTKGIRDEDAERFRRQIDAEINWATTN